MTVYKTSKNKKEEDFDFQLTEEQKTILIEQENISLEEYIDADEFLEKRKKKKEIERK